ncbi:substrate-binding periplasmic protein [Inhella gelatinilytica]|uniref:Transporter substrate-binding domain-containing protein n=1 Tax=Inhella gelatinilytica TaxID=2795030 RepID=A0A931NC43_9BURK|nr:transporter substrate-binding domain-containing protein [Inhella gelatinilytica]MBH9554283.1 transporter substrate-binding domain-containing protein [Inhella gelatinilytica]
MTADLAPFAMAGAAPGQGALVDLTRAMAKRAGLQLEVEFVPWARAQQDAQQQPRTLILPLTRTPEREASYTWVARLSWHPFGFQGLKRQPRVQSIEHAKTLRVGVLRGAPQQQQLQDLGFTQVVLVANNTDLHRMLQEGMVDAICGSLLINLYSARVAGYDPADYQAGARLGGGEIWLAAATDSGLSEDERNRLQRAAAQLEAEGLPRRLFRKYGVEAPVGP